ncbi:MAG: phosphatase PAP2 family protein [archaeon]|nr:phosphatase PAP2 family protein [archaeon]
MQNIYLTWLISALALGVLLLPFYKPKWMRLTLHSFVDFFRRYWIHILMTFIIYNAKDALDQIDRILMASAGFDMTPYVWAIEGDLVLWVQQTFEADWLSHLLTHFYVVGFMFICYVSIFYFAYFDDRWMADRVALSISYVYLIAVPFYLFFNVQVTGKTIPEMDTIAYSLTPEIADWFRRIDPFSNGMPSLHIGIPFCVWLCLVRFDHDNRWKRYRYTVLAYIILTAFTIVYLGIHWFLDIIGGMLVAAVAVSWADKTANGWWKFFDERTINSRIVTVLTQPKKAISFLVSKAKTTTVRFRHPTSKETGQIAVFILILTAAVVTYDLTHQALPAEGVQAPEAVVAADGWLATLDNRSGVATLVVHNLSDLEVEPFVFENLKIDLNTSFSIKDHYLGVSTLENITIFDLGMNGTVVNTFSVSNSQDIHIIELESSYALTYLENASIYGMTFDDIELDGDFKGITDVVVYEPMGNEIAYVSSNSPTTVSISQIGINGHRDYVINASAPVVEDEVLALWGTPVDIENASIVEMAFDKYHLAVTVNVTATDRLILVDRNTSSQWLVSNPKYQAAEPALGYGRLAWVAKDHLNPTSPQNQYLDFELYYVDFETNRSNVLTVDNLDQHSPQVLEQHIVYVETDDEGISTVQVHSWEPTLQTYSSLVLQIGIVLAVIVVFIHVMQRQKEHRNR